MSADLKHTIFFYYYLAELYCFMTYVARHNITVLYLAMNQAVISLATDQMSLSRGANG